MASSSTSSLPLAGRVAILTGASGSIGRDIALHLASLGADLVLGYSSSSAKADQLAADINNSKPSSGSGPRAVAVKVDVSNEDSVKSLFDAAESTFQRAAHIMVACAGIQDDRYRHIKDMDVEAFEKISAVNARGVFLCCREAANRLARGGGGRVIVISSSLVASLLPGYASYAASKAAAEALVKILAKELKGTGITANSVAPGPVATDMFFAGKTEQVVERMKNMSPMGRIGEVGDISPVVGFLCTDAAEWVNGQVLRVNGGAIIA